MCCGLWAGTVLGRPNTYRALKAARFHCNHQSLVPSYKRGVRCSQRVPIYARAQSLPSAIMRGARSVIRDLCKKQLSDLEAQGLLKNERIITSKQASTILVEGYDKKVINFCANNYLGLSSNDQVISAGVNALRSHGAGLSSVRFICGTQDIHKELEQKLSSFHNREDTILYASCFDANAGIFEALLTPEDAVLSDELNHASIIDGVRLCKAQKFRYKHRDMADLESKLIEASGNSRLKLIVTDGVFSMDGNVAPLEKIVALAEKYGALTLVDDCHATGFFGNTGRGTEEYCNVLDKVDFINSTLGKAIGGAAGGYTTGPKEVITMLRQKSRPYLFSNSLPPPVVASASKALDLVMEGSYQAFIQSNTQQFREEMTEAGFRLLGDNHPICPVLVGDAKLSAQLAEAMIKRDIYVVSFNYPVVPKEKARIRVQISAAHTAAQIQTAVEAFKTEGRKLGIIT